MSNVINGKEALMALANGEEVELKSHHWDDWQELTGDFSLNVFSLSEYSFRLKPRTILINGIEVPAPFRPKNDEEDFFRLAPLEDCGYCLADYGEAIEGQFGAWRTEEEIKQVVSVLRSIFGGIK